MQKEGEQVTKSHILQSRKKLVDKSFVVGFSLVGLYQQLYTLCPTMTSILHKFSTNNKQELAMNDRIKLRKQQVSTYLCYFGTISRRISALGRPCFRYLENVVNRIAISSIL